MVSFDAKRLTGRQLQAARVLVGISASELATKSKVGLATIKRAEALAEETIKMTAPNAEAVVRALEDVGIIFLAKNGEGVGVRLKS